MSRKEGESGVALNGENFGDGEYGDWMGRVGHKDRPNVNVMGGEPTTALGLEGPMTFNPIATHFWTDPNDPNVTHPVNHTQRGKQVTPVARVQRWKRRAREVNEASSIGPSHGVEKKRRSEGKGGNGVKGVLEHGVISEIDPSQGEDKKRKFEDKWGKGDHEDLERESINKKVRTGEVLSGTNYIFEAAEAESQPRRTP
ncbi:hypothetical protein U1Q18_028026 [Sarracenia purpurea var. burkii]